MTLQEYDFRNDGDDSLFGDIAAAHLLIAPAKGTYLVFLKKNRDYYYWTMEEADQFDFKHIPSTIAEYGAYIAHIKDKWELMFFKVLHSDKIEVVIKVKD